MAERVHDADGTDFYSRNDRRNKPYDDEMRIRSAVASFDNPLDPQQLPLTQEQVLATLSQSNLTSEQQFEAARRLGIDVYSGIED